MAIQIVDKKRFMLLIIIVSILVVSLIFLGIKFFDKDVPSQKPQGDVTIYEALIQPFDQKSENSDEISYYLQKGDVIVIFPEGHSWSAAEKTSYIILKLKLTKEEADKLLEVAPKENQEKNDKEILGPQRKAIGTRKYRLKIENLNFDLQKFWDNPVQPYPDQVLDNSLIEEKQYNNFTE